jgi:Protein of unknown function (DUF3455)
MTRGISLAGFAVLLAAGIAGCSHNKAVLPKGVPAAVAVRDTQVLTRMLHGSGVQIYACQADPQNAKRFTWVFQAPAADLSDRTGKDVGRHYAGPTFEGNDGSKVVAEVVAKDPGPAANAIPWLLLHAKSNTGKGIFAKTQTIQRLHTIGGLQPDSGCDANHLGQRTRVAYSADYYFYNARR